MSRPAPSVPETPPKPAARNRLEKVTRPTMSLKGFWLFLDAYWWLVVYHLKPNWLLVMSVGVLSFISAASHALTIGFIAFTLDFFQNPRTIGIGVLDRLLGNPGITLLIFGVLLTAVSITGTWARFRSALTCRRIGRLFHERVLGESVRGVNSIGVIPESLGLTDEANLQRSISRNGAILGRTTESLVRMIEPLLRLVVGIGILVYIDWRMGFILVPLIVFVFPGMYMVNARLRRISDVFYESSTPLMGQRVRDVVQFINSQNVDQHSGRGQRIDDSLIDDDSMAGYLNEFDSMTLASQRVQFVLNSINATALGLALVGAGYLASHGEIRWSEAMASLMALWQIQQASLQCGSGLSMLTRFYSFIVQTRKLLSIGVNPLADQPSVATDASGTPLILTCGTGQPSGQDQLCCSPGGRAYLITDTVLDRLNLNRILEPLSTASGKTIEELVGITSFVNSRFKVFDETFEEAIGANPDIDVPRLLDDLGLVGEMQALGVSLKTRLGRDHWSQMSGPMRSVFTLVSAVRSPCPVLVCDGRLLHGLAPAVSDRLLGLFDDRFVLIHHTSSQLKRSLADHFIVIENGVISGIGQEAWFRGIAGTLRVGSAPASADAEEFADMFE